MNIFEQASVMKLRFPSNKGELTVEHLWDLPLESKTGFDLDSIAKSVNSALKSLTEESFVARTTSPAKSKQELMLDIVKHVIAVKIKVAEEARDRAEKKAKKDKLLDVLAKKQDQALESLSTDDLIKQINELS
jgi:hypothetical protein